MRKKPKRKAPSIQMERQRQYGKRLVTCTSNNTKAVRTWYSLRDQKWYQIVKTSGSRGYQNSKRGRIYAGEERIQERIKEYHERQGKGSKLILFLIIKGLSSTRALLMNGRKGNEKKGLWKIYSIEDGTADVHNGCRQKKKRRI